MRQQKSCQPSRNRDSRRKRKRKGDWKYMWRNYGLKLFKSKKEIEIQIQQALRVPNKMNTKRFISRHIILQMAKIKGNKRILNAAREKQNQLKYNFYKAISWFLWRNFAGQKQWHNIFEVQEGKNFQPWILYSAKWSFIIDGERKHFSAK